MVQGFSAMFAQSTIDTRLHPFEAVKAVRRLMADPEDTRQIFAIFRAMRGRSAIRAFRRFAASPTGHAVLADRRRLLDTLSDRAALAALAPGSVGRAYFDFMEEEKLSADGLVAASQSWETDTVPADLALFRERMRDAHDLTHILTGYGRDGLGELCLLAFMFSHTRNLGMALIVAMSWTKLPQPARDAVIEAWRSGRKARWLQDQDFEALLARPLDTVRRELNIATPSYYRAVVA
jgi:ubiquinone biosynthesis protein COQ4